MATSQFDRCPTCRRRMVRSHPQNARYWALLHLLSEKLHPKRQTFSPSTLHIWAKSKFLGCDDFVLPNGKTLTIPKSTAGLDVAEFNDYMTALEAWANTEAGVFLEDIPT